MKVLTTAEAEKIPRRKIFSLPLRMVRTNKAKVIDGIIAELIAKSRLVVPGHVDPELGDFRTDAPTTQPTAIALASTIAASMGWTAWVFDVAAAFLSGKETEREVFIRAPKEGLPKARGEAAVRPHQFLQILKSAYGLTEAPRLWYLRARELMLECGFVELACCKATFVLLSPATGLVAAICCLHVDDGFLVGGMSAFVTSARNRINDVFNIKEWTCLQHKETDYLGFRAKQLEDFTIVMSMKDYVMQMQPINMETMTAERDVTEPERSALLSLVMKAAWPARHCMPQALYGVSRIAQAVKAATTEHVKGMNKHLDFMKAEAQADRAQLRYVKIDLATVRVITPFDASFAGEDGGKSQAGFLNLVTDDRTLSGEALANVVEFGSNKISRVVRSTMAAESAALSLALDRQLYVRMLLEALMYGERAQGYRWKENLSIPGMVLAQTRTQAFIVPGNMVTDAKSLYDHLSRTGNLPTERQVMLDLLAAKELEEANVTKIRWVPSVHQLADALTKNMQSAILTRFLTTNLYSLVQTGAEAEAELHRASLRREQRQRRKLRSKSEVTA
jgi:hypothetical protein